ncbi:glycosyltransferase family 4 protein [Tepidimonas fonticaldi]|uniref:glycosyltransferase family 4 protein n=1 Tax=Tepidimonas fonticaldi TaxID=1101373 RepID=UPI0018D4454E|nr:glycosyltransferase family 4 protein [Tepidimonas fonticaldi]
MLIGHAAQATLNFRAPLLADLVAAGWRVEVLAPDWTAAQRQRLQAMGVRAASFPLARTGLNPVQDLRTFMALLRHLRRERPQAVFTYAAKTNVWGMLAAAVAGVPRRVAMVEGLGYAFTDGAEGRRTPKQRLIGAVLTTLYRMAFAAAHRVVVLNPDDARDLQRECGLTGSKTVLLGGIGVPLEDWPMHPPHTHPMTFTLVARLLREKGVLEFLQAARRVKARHPATRFWVLGPLDDNPGGLREADLRPWLDNGTVEWPGAVDVKPWLAQTSVFVLPSSYREGVPRSTQEAMAMGRPVITTDAPGCRETVVEGVNGFLVPPRDVEALQRAMLRFIEEPELVERMGQESRRLAEERFDVRQANAILLKTMGLG